MKISQITVGLTALVCLQIVEVSSTPIEMLNPRFRRAGGPTGKQGSAISSPKPAGKSATSRQVLEDKGFLRGTGGGPKASPNPGNEVLLAVKQKPPPSLIPIVILPPKVASNPPQGPSTATKAPLQGGTLSPKASSTAGNLRGGKQLAKGQTQAKSQPLKKPQASSPSPLTPPPTPLPPPSPPPPPPTWQPLTQSSPLPGEALDDSFLRKARPGAQSSQPKSGRLNSRETSKKGTGLATAAPPAVNKPSVKPASLESKSGGPPINTKPFISKIVATPASVTKYTYTTTPAPGTNETTASDVQEEPVYVDNNEVPVAKGPFISKIVSIPATITQYTYTTTPASNNPDDEQYYDTV